MTFYFSAPLSTLYKPMALYINLRCATILVHSHRRYVALVCWYWSSLMATKRYWRALITNKKYIIVNLM